MKFEVTILGCGSALPTGNRNPSSQLINLHEQYILIDCGEGTQLQLRRNKAKFQRISFVLISHMHGDHFLGLPGLLQTMHLLGRKQKLTIFGPSKLKKLIDLHLEVSESKLNYPIEFIKTQDRTKELLFESKLLEIHSFPLDHRIACTGFLIQEKQRLQSIKPGVVEEYKIPLEMIPKIRQGADWESEDGKQYVNKQLAYRSEKPRSYAYCSDTAFFKPLIESVKGVSMMYHEATFLTDMKDRARATKHSTAREAAIIAKEAEVGKLLIGHYSARYYDSKKFKEEAQVMFQNVVNVEDGQKFTIKI